MIQFFTSGAKIIVRIETGLFDAKFKTVDATLECGSELFAELLTRQLEDNFDKKTEQVRKIEYSRGRRRKLKSEFFYYGLSDNAYSKTDE